MRRLLAVLTVLAAALVIATGGVVLWAQQQFDSPGPLAQPATLVIPKGSGLETIALRLREAGVIAEPRIFMAGALWHGWNKMFKAGEYAFVPGQSPRAVAEQLRDGRTVVRKITFAEGLTSAQMVAHLMAAEGFAGTVDKIPPEGGLMPETYYYGFGDARSDLVARMGQAMRDAIAEAWDKRQPGLPLATTREALILASIVEKETGLPEERPRVAAVFINRLRQGMKLQSDPTIIYALSGGAGAIERALSHDDLALNSPYNTYRIDRLPPGPICNPGKASLNAVLHPAAGEELYFVADGTGGHAFAKTLAEHNANVARWRKIERERGK